jgi:hypothetical protein
MQMDSVKHSKCFIFYSLPVSLPMFFHGFAKLVTNGSDWAECTPAILKNHPHFGAAQISEGLIA